MLPTSERCRGPGTGDASEPAEQHRLADGVWFAPQGYKGNDRGWNMVVTNHPYL